MIAQDERDLIRKRLLGRGLACVPVEDLERDLSLTRTSNGHVDLAMVEGVENLGQSLAIAMTTALGGDVFNIDFGFDGLNALGEAAPPVLVRERIRVAVVKLLRKDPRVSRIVDVKLVGQQPDSGSLQANRELQIHVAFETVTGDRLALSAGSLGARITNG